MIRLGIIAEDRSDIATLSVLVGRIKNRHYRLRKYAAKGCGRLRRKCGKIACHWAQYNTTYMIICHDLDSGDVTRLRSLRSELEAKVCDIPQKHRVVCIVIPIQELEAWFLADVQVLNQKFLGMGLREIPNPENIPSPKEYIQKKSRGSNSRPRYVNTLHNPELASKLDISKVREKCPAFQPFYNFVSSLP